MASGLNSHAEGKGTIASAEYSHAEGSRTVASGYGSHAEGDGTIASAAGGSHAEGNETVASGSASHAEGGLTIASGNNSHAEGSYSEASGRNSHAEGFRTIAQRKSQHVFGEYNNADATGTTTSRGTYVEIVGNGSGTSNRSNARTLDWNGNEILADKLTVGATPTANMDVTTKQYVDNAISNVGGLTATVSNQTLFLTM